MTDDLDNLTYGLQQIVTFFNVLQKVMQSTFVYAIKFQFLGTKFGWSVILLILQFFREWRILNCNYADAITNVLLF